MQKYLNQELVSFIKDFWDESLEITAETKIEDDLGITGDDADEFLVAFSKKFNVSLKKFIFKKYFESEPSLFSHFKSAPSKRLTVNMLVEAIEKGELI
jgi:acyl carrier protein